MPDDRYEVRAENLGDEVYYAVWDTGVSKPCCVALWRTRELAEGSARDRSEIHKQTLPRKAPTSEL